MRRWRARRRRTTRRWPRWPAASAIRRCATAAPSAAASPTTTPRPATRPAALASGATIVTNTRRDRGGRLLPGHVHHGARRPARSSPRCGSRSRNGRATRSSSSRPRALPLVGVFVAKYADGVRVAVTGASENGVFRWTEAEAALSTIFRRRGGQGPVGQCRWHDRRPARHARIPRASGRGADRAGGDGGRLSRPDRRTGSGAALTGRARSSSQRAAKSRPSRAASASVP